jgi:hypothetical protein
MLTLFIAVCAVILAFCIGFLGVVNVAYVGVEACTQVRTRDGLVVPVRLQVTGLWPIFGPSPRGNQELELELMRAAQVASSFLSATSPRSQEAFEREFRAEFTRAVSSRRWLRVNRILVYVDYPERRAPQVVEEELNYIAANRLRQREAPLRNGDTPWDQWTGGFPQHSSGAPPKKFGKLRSGRTRRRTT